MLFWINSSHAMEVAIKILQLLVSKLDGESMNIERFLELVIFVFFLQYSY
ncbi:unnamed protein product [Arabidopsis halleri]